LKSANEPYEEKHTNEEKKKKEEKETQQNCLERGRNDFTR
jgi:hypothetical protein